MLFIYVLEIALWYLTGVLGSRLAYDALYSRSRDSSFLHMDPFAYAIAVGGPFNLVSVLILFGRDCLRKV